MQPYVLGFVGQNANGILRWWTENILDGFTRHGYTWKLIDLLDSAWPARLGEIMNAGAPQFCFSFQGMGMDIKVNNENTWTRAGIPFFSYLGDNPYHAPRLHAAHAPGMYLLYGCRDFLETYQRFLNGRAYAAVVPTGYPANPHADRKPWKERQHEIVFAKTGVNPAATREHWKKLPVRVRPLVEESAELVLSGADDTIANCCATVFAARQIHWGDARELFLSVCSSVDFYARAVRAERMVRDLMPHNALIVGDWSWLDRTGSRARFIDPIAATALDELYADSRIIANTLPSVRYGTHRRRHGGPAGKVRDRFRIYTMAEQHPRALSILLRCEWRPRRHTPLRPQRSRHRRENRNLRRSRARNVLHGKLRHRNTQLRRARALPQSRPRLVDLPAPPLTTPTPQQ
jgi:hypothetical protein